MTMETRRLARAAFGLAVIVASSCASSSGNLYFLSAQRIGLEVAASDPATNAGPKILIGYESVKGTVNPVKNKNGTLRAQAYSVLGITGTKTSGSSEAGLAVSEWFATGEAARVLAGNKLTPIALAGTKTLTPEVLALATSEQLAKTYEAISASQVWLDKLTDRSSRQQAILDGLDGLAWIADDLQFQKVASDGSRSVAFRPSSSKWNRIEVARLELKDSINVAKNRSKNANLTQDERQQASDAAVALQKKLDEFDRQILNSDAARAAWTEFTDIVKR